MVRGDTAKQGFAKKYLSDEVKVVSVIFLSILAVFALSFFWHEFVPYDIPNISLSLKEFDYVAFEDSNVCFKVVLQPYHLDGNVGYPLSFIAGEKTLGSANPSVHEDSAVIDFCFLSTELNQGDNLVEILSGNKRLFFHVEKVSEPKPETDYKLEILDVNSSFVMFSFESSGLFSYKPIELTINEEQRLVYPTEKKQVFLEKISLNEGSNSIALSYGGKSATSEIMNEPPLTMPVLVGALLFSLLLLVLALFVFSDYPLFEKFSISLAVSGALIIAITFILNLFMILSLTSFVLSFVAVILILFFVFREKFKQGFSVFTDNWMHPLILISLLVIVNSALFFHLTSWDHITYWNGFYEKHSASMAEGFAQPLFDELSYFGRVIGFIPGYFFLEASFSWLLGISDTTLFAIMLLFANLIFFGAVFYFGESLKFSLPKRALLFILLWFESFIRVGITISPRHAISLAFLLIALAILIKRKDYLLSAVVLGIGAFIQTPVLLAFPVLYIIVAEKIEWRPLIKTCAIALAIFGVLYAPNFVAFGVLEQADATNWGYLIDYTVENLFADLGPLIIFFLVFHLVSIFKGEIKFNSYSKKLAIAAVLGILFLFFVSYRWNVYNAVNIAVLLVYWFPDKALFDKYTARLLAITFVLAALLLNAWSGAYSLSTYQQGPFEYLSDNVSYGSRILADPLFGHGIEYVSGKRVMADLAVEYADQQKLLDTYRFLQDKDYSVLSEYNIDYVVNQSDMVNRNAFKNKRLDIRLEFEKLNKIYDNDFIYVHQVPQEVDNR